jgi:ABC-type lipoprotein release transport system permease subunit
MTTTFHGLKTAVFLAFKDILRNKRTILMVLVSLAFCFVNLFFISSIIKGFSKTFAQDVIKVYGHIMVTPKEDQAFLENSGKLEKQLKRFSNVECVTSRINSGVSIIYKKRTFGELASGISPEQEKELSVLPTSVIKGSFLKKSDTSQVVLGKEVADKLRKESNDGLLVGTGEDIEILYQNGIKKRYNIKGIVDSKDFLAVNSILITENEINNVLGLDNQSSEICVKLKDPAALNKTKNEIKQVADNARVLTWKDKAGFLEDVMDGVDVIRQILSGVSLLLTAVIISIIIYINTQSKKRQIGILKAIGARNGVISSMFIVQSAVFAVLGILLGSIIFFGIAKYLQLNPIDLPFGDLVPYVETNLAVTYIIAFFLSSLLAGFYPARKAAKGIIIDAIRGE